MLSSYNKVKNFIPLKGGAAGLYIKLHSHKQMAEVAADSGKREKVLSFFLLDSILIN